MSRIKSTKPKSTKTKRTNTTPEGGRDATRTAPHRAPTAAPAPHGAPTAGADQKIWRHPAEQALLAIAREEDVEGTVEVMADVGGKLDVTMSNLYRIEVRHGNTRIVPLKSAIRERDESDRGWMIPEGVALLARILAAIALATQTEDELLAA